MNKSLINYEHESWQLTHCQRQLDYRRGRKDKINYENRKKEEKKEDKKTNIRGRGERREEEITY